MNSEMMYDSIFLGKMLLICFLTCLTFGVIEWLMRNYGDGRSFYEQENNKRKLNNYTD